VLGFYHYRKSLVLVLLVCKAILDIFKLMLLGTTKYHLNYLDKQSPDLLRVLQFVYGSQYYDMFSTNAKDLY
jgi:membrane-bound acyltransferase YfiQ involved in biofilm formation